MQHIIPYIQQLTKFSFHCSNEELQISLQTTEDRGPSFLQSFLLWPPWATKWLMRLACTGRWNLSEFSKVWREMIRVTATAVEWSEGWAGDFSSDDIPETQQASDVWNNKNTWNIVATFLEGGVMSKQHIGSHLVIFYETKEIYNGKNLTKCKSHISVSRWSLQNTVHLQEKSI